MFKVGDRSFKMHLTQQLFQNWYLLKIAIEIPSTFQMFNILRKKGFSMGQIPQQNH
jgi:hypothetical protein